MSLRDGLVTHLTVAQRYAHMVETGALARDPAQQKVVAALDRLIDRIEERRLARKSSALGLAVRQTPQEGSRDRTLHPWAAVGARQDHC